MARRSPAPADAAPADVEAVAPTLPPPARFVALTRIWFGWADADGAVQTAHYEPGDEIPAAHAAAMDASLYEPR